MKKIIKYALEHNNVIPFFQPITNRDGKITKYEALVRILDFKDGKEKINQFKTPQNIVVEITEQESVESFEQIFKAVTKLRKLGVSIA